MEFKHIPVMLSECITALSPKDNGIYLIYVVIEENGVEHKITKYINIKCLKIC